ncbi:MAG: HlyD family secretion protein [Clostridia bacterium]|nr:HlyD family secretion protein [Clostridia bacterium]
MKKKYLKYGVIGVLCLAVLSGTFIRYYLDKKDNSKNVAQYAIVEVKRGDIQVTASGTGSIEASVRKEIMTLNNGIVDKIYVEEGQFVNEGDLILTFENNTENSMIERAKLNVYIAENNLKELEGDLENLKIYAPASGVVGDIEVNTGEELSKGYILTTITDKSKLEATGQFNKSQIKNIKVGDKAEVLILGSFQTINGTVTKVNETPGDNEGAVLYGVTVEVDNPGGLTSGMKVQITINNDKGSFAAVENTGLKIKTPYDVKLLYGGILKKLNISSGDYVNKGELLAELENTSLQTQIDTQKIKLEQSRLELSEKLQDLDNTAIYSPISGTITKINVTEGEQIRENSAVAVVSDLDNLEVVIPVDELDINKVKVGQKAVVTVEAVPEMEYSAEVSKIALEGSTTGGVATFDVTLSLNDTKGLKPGMTANAEIISSNKKNVLLLPIEAIQQRGKQKFVITGDEKNLKQDKPNITPIKIGLVSEQYVEITEGLNEGDKVFYPLVSKSTQNQQRIPGMGMMGAGRERPSGGKSGGGR